MRPISRDLRDLLACPQCLGSLGDVKSGDVLSGLRCDRCLVVYPIESGRPVLVVDAGVPLKQQPD